MVGHMRRIGALYTLIDIHNYDRPLVMIKETSDMCSNTLFEYTEVLFYNILSSSTSVTSTSPTFRVPLSDLADLLR